MSDTYIQLPTDGDGQKLRSFEKTEYDPSAGAEATITGEGVVVTDTNGVPVDFEDSFADLAELLNDVRVGLAHLILLTQEIGAPAGGLADSTARFVDRVLGEIK